VTAAGRYLLGLAATAAGAALATGAARADIRAEIAWGALTGLVLQAPLGWWVVQSIGTERFVLTWGLGMLVRLTAVAIAALVVVPLTRWQAGPMLGALVAVLVALLVVEAVTALKEHSRE
jgi:heme A synthase